MTEFTKKILQPGTYSVPVAGSRTERQPVTIDEDRIDRWIDSFGQMQEAGLKIPAPWRHDPKAEPVRLDGDSQDIDSFKNAGFWTDLYKGDDGALYGTLDVPREEDASRVGKSVQECSPLAKPEWEDGSGTKYGDSITHIALVTHPVVPGQENFKPKSRQHKELAAAHIFSSENFIGALGGPDRVDDVRSVLAKVGIVLPEDTTPENVIDRIITAGTALAAADDGEGSVDSPPNNAVERTVPITMSEELKFNPYTGDELKDGEKVELPEVKLSEEDQASINFARKIGRKTYVSRVENLVTSGRVAPAYAKERLAPYLDDLQLSFDSEGNAVAGQLDVLLEALEALPQASTLTGAASTVAKRTKGAFNENAFSLEATEQIPEDDQPVDHEKGADDQLQTAGLRKVEGGWR